VSVVCETINADVTVGGSKGTLLANRYRVVRQLGQGGMGSVWLAADTQLNNREVAIKMLPSILVSNKRAYNQLKAEALVSLRLTHPNIAAVRAFEENGGNPFLVVDYIEGQTLDDYLVDKGKFSEEEIVDLLGPIASALDYAHGEGVVHRDVKPGNVMIRKDGHPFILDFGIAREIQETMTRVTGKLSSGTLMYMSPEQLHGAAPKPAQDVYSFAAMAYECLRGAPPFSRGQIEYQIEHDMPVPLDKQVVKCGPGIMAGLAKDPNDRPANCADVLTGMRLAASAGQKKSVVTSHRLVAAVVLPLVLAVVCAAGYVWHRGRQDAISSQAKIARLAEEKKALEAEKAEAAAARARTEQAVAEAARKEKERIEAEKARKAEEKARAVADQKNRRDTFSELARVKTQISIKCDLAKAAMKNLETYRVEAVGFKSHFDTVDAQWKNVETLPKCDDLSSAKKVLATVSEASDVIAYELRWIETNKKGRDDAVAIENAIVKVLEPSLTRYDAKNMATALYDAGVKLRQESKTLLESGQYNEAGEKFAQAKLKLQEAVVEARSYHVRTAMASAKEFLKAGLLDKALKEAERAVSFDPANTEASNLRADIQVKIEEIARAEKEKQDAEDRKRREAEQAALKRSSSYMLPPAKHVAHKPKKTPITKTILIPGGASLELVYCEPGEFNMGTPRYSVSDEGEAEHFVKIEKGFWIGKYEITQRQWQSVMGANPSTFVAANHPVENVTFESCGKFFAKLKEAGIGARFPTEEEWEYACRGGSETSLPNGLRMMILSERYAPELDSIAWYGGNSSVDCKMPNAVNCSDWKGVQYEGQKAATHPVGAKDPNDFGLYDVLGNVWELCRNESHTILRGGAWDSIARDCRAARRRVRTDNLRPGSIGFRICMDTVSSVAEIDMGVAADKPVTETEYYVVRSGDTLGSIAYSRNMTIRDLKQLNNLQSERMRVGQKLLVRVRKDR